MTELKITEQEKAKIKDKICNYLKRHPQRIIPLGLIRIEAIEEALNIVTLRKYMKELMNDERCIEIYRRGYKYNVLIDDFNGYLAEYNRNSQEQNEADEKQRKKEKHEEEFMKLNLKVLKFQTSRWSISFIILAIIVSIVQLIIWFLSFITSLFPASG